MQATSYAITPDPALTKKSELSPKELGAAFRAFFRILELWGVSNDQARVLLGQPARSTFYKWKRGDVTGVAHDTVRRLSYVLGIYKALQVLFKKPEQADAWVHRSSSDFGGSSALDRMLGGDVTDLAVVRSYLDGVRGQGA